MRTLCHSNSPLSPLPTTPRPAPLSVSLPLPLAPFLPRCVRVCVRVCVRMCVCVRVAVWLCICVSVFGCVAVWLCGCVLVRVYVSFSTNSLSLTLTRWHCFHSRWLRVCLCACVRVCL